MISNICDFPAEFEENARSYSSTLVSNYSMLTEQQESMTRNTKGQKESEKNQEEEILVESWNHTIAFVFGIQ